MSTDQRASERVGELIHHTFDSLLQANTGLERLRDLIGLGMDLGQLLAPHSQMTWKLMVPQEKRFRENWDEFMSVMRGVGLSAGPNVQQAEVKAVTAEPESAPLPAIAACVPEEVTAVMQVEDDYEPELGPPRRSPTPLTSDAPTPVTILEEPKQSQILPPVGSVENPMKIEGSDEDEVVQRSVVAAKRKMKAAPPDGETPGKRPKPASDGPFLFENLGPVATPKTQPTSDGAVESSKKPSPSAQYSWKPHKDADVQSYGQDRELLHERLDQLGPPFYVDRGRITHDRFVITRADITSIYGGENVSSFPRIGKEARARHPYRDFLHGNFVHNPFLPPEPGWPGLFFRLDEKFEHRDVDGDPIVYRTFARHADRRCVYLGQYILTRLEDISKQEWRDLPDKTKTIWLKFFGSSLLANLSLARIALRVSQWPNEPTETQISAKYESITPKHARKALAEKLEKEIRRAFTRGEERIVVWGMKCVSYDYKFEVDLATKWQGLSKDTGGRAKPKQKRGRKSQLSTSEESEGGDEDEAPVSRSRDHLWRSAKSSLPCRDTTPVIIPVESSEDEEYWSPP